LKYRIALRRWTDAVVVNASTIVAPFASLDGFGAERVHVIHNGVTAPITRRNPLLIRNEIGIPGDAFVIGTVARLAIQKRIDRLVNAVSLLPSDVHCVIAGEGTRREEIEAEIDRLSLRDRVHLVGHRNDVPDIMSALDVFVLSSDTEGLSNSMLEAMSLGKPVISTDVSGARDALAGHDGDGPSGLIVDFSAASIADAVTQLRENAALRARLGQSAAHRAVTSFSFEVMLDRWEKLLASA
jgi:glycosyltransferase involved in cell wall biosynthesis